MLKKYFVREQYIMSSDTETITDIKQTQKPDGILVETVLPTDPLVEEKEVEEVEEEVQKEEKEEIEVPIKVQKEREESKFFSKYGHLKKTNSLLVPRKGKRFDSADYFTKLRSSK